ncbi:hypothetical protein ACJD0Z_16755 [Flavobacteriaceae bacterium M23B6Z8]
MKSKIFSKLKLRKLRIAQLSEINGGAAPDQEDTHTGVTTTIPTRTQPSRTLSD